MGDWERHHSLAWELVQSRFRRNCYSLLDFMPDWDMEAPASFEPLPLSTWTSRAGKGDVIDFALLPLAWHDLVQWNAVIPRVTLALQGQEDHRLVAAQVALQPKSLLSLSRRPPFIRSTSRGILPAIPQNAMPPLLWSPFPS